MSTDPRGPTDRTAAELAIRRTIAAYCHTVDDGRFDEFAHCWAADATVTVMGQTHAGRDAIVDWITAAQPPQARGKHCTFEPHITFESDDRARGAVDFLFVGRDADGRPAISTTGRYVDTYVRAGDGWVFASREIVLDR